MSCRRCRYQHGVVDGLCGDCSRWAEHFTAEERTALAGALAAAVLMEQDSPLLTRLRLELLTARVDDGAFGQPHPALVAARVSETGG